MKMRKFLAILCVIAMLCGIAPMISAEESVIASNLEHAAGWAQTDMNTTLWGGTVDPSVIVEGGSLDIHLTANAADLWQVRVCLNGNQWTEMDWHVDPSQVTNPCGTLTNNGDGTLVVSFAYDDMVSLYGTSDFAGTLGSITIATNGASAVTVNKVVYVSEVAAEPELLCEQVLFEGSAAVADKWQMATEMETLNCENGTLDQSIFTEGGALKLYYTGTCGQVYAVLMDSVNWGWMQANPSSTKEVEGGYVSTFTFENLANVYGKSDLSDLGKLVVGSTNADDIVITKIVWATEAHDYTNQTLGTQVSEASCTSGATYYVACDKCGVDSETVIESGDSLGHDMSEADCENAPVCKREGCGHTEGEKLGHNYVGVVTTQPNCTTEGVKTYTCENDPTHTYTEPVAVDAEAHSWDEGVVTKAPTCSAKGEKTYTCKHNEQHTKVEELDADPAAHTDTDDDGFCDDCEAECCRHEYESVVTDPTCEEKGYTTYSCKLCSYSYVGDYKDKLGHTWTDATCTAPKTCSVCETTEGEALGHTWVNADCEHAKTCSVCEVTEGEANGHTWTDATCTAPKTCSVCEVTEGEALGHTWVDADCEHAKTCSVCEATEGEALGHTWVDADCEHAKTCSVCETTEGEALGHTWDDGVVTKEATTEAAGEKTYTCSVCNGTKTEVIAKLPSGDATVIYTSDTAIASGWQMAVQVYTTLWEGTLDPATFTDGGELVVTLSWTTDGFWNAHLALQSIEKNADGKDWFQISVEKADMTDNGDGTYSFAIPYDTLAENYGFDSFDNLGCLYLYVNSDEGTTVTVNSIAYEAAEVSGDEPVEDPTEAPTEAPDDDVVYEEVVKENVLHEESVTVESGWQPMVQLNTVLWGGTLDHAAIVENGELAVNVSCSTEGLWSVHLVMQGTGASNGWQQIDVEVAQMTINEDGSYTATFKYADLIAKYGSADFSDLGALHVYCNSDAGAQVTLNSVSYNSVEKVPVTGDTHILGAVIAMLAASAMGIGVVIKKKEF